MLNFRIKLLKLKKKNEENSGNRKVIMEITGLIQFVWLRQLTQPKGNHKHCHCVQGTINSIQVSWNSH